MYNAFSARLNIFTKGNFNTLLMKMSNTLVCPAVKTCQKVDKSQKSGTSTSWQTACGTKEQRGDEGGAKFEIKEKK